MKLDAKRYYAVLGVDPVCSDEEIRHAFRRRAKELHPDAETGSASAFILLKRAYDTLSDPVSRARYDRTRLLGFRRRPRDGAPPPPRPVRHRPGGMSVTRYVVAFLFMAGLSYGAIELMISLADVPAGSTVRPAGPSVPGSPAPTAAKAGSFGSSPNGFWDASNPNSLAEPPAPPAPSGPRPAKDAWPPR